MKDTSHRLYIKRGYIPGGSGLWYNYSRLEPYSNCNDDENPEDFEKHVTHFYPFSEDKLIIGKFCAIEKGI